MGKGLVEDSIHLSIGVLSERYGVSLRTLRFYEEVGLLAPVRAGNHRLYTKKDEIRLQVVRIGVRFGFSLGEIKRLIDLYVSQNGSEPARIEPLLDVDLIEQQICQLEQRSAALDAALQELKTARDGPDRVSAGAIPGPDLEPAAALARVR